MSSPTPSTSSPTPSTSSPTPSTSSPTQFEAWKQGQPGFLRTENACRTGKRCCDTLMDLLDASVVTSDLQGVKEFQGLWLTSVKLYIQMLARFSWCPSPFLESILRATELYAIAVGIRRPDLPQDLYFESELSPGVLATSWAVAVELEAEECDDQFMIRVEDMEKDPEDSEGSTTDD